MPESPPDSSPREAIPFDKLEALVRRHEELSCSMADPSVLADPKKYQELARLFGELEPVVPALWSGPDSTRAAFAPPKAEFRQSACL